jgi:flagella basal body P-ring formation protein FlgA
MTRSAGLKTRWFFFVVMASGLSAEAAEIRLKEDVSSSGSIVLLGDVAEIRDSDVQQAAALRRMELFPSPSQDDCRVLRQRELRELLVLHGFDSTRITISGALVTRIHPGRNKAPVSVARKPDTDKPALSIVVTRRELQRGEVLRAADLELKTIDKVPKNFSPLFDPQAAVGLEVTRSVPAGYALDARLTQRPILIRRGEPVTVYALAAGIRVRTTARSLGQGGLGDLILLESLENRERFSARITGVQRAEVYAASVPVRNGGWPESASPRISQRSD